MLAPSCRAELPYRGVNLSGAEFGSQALPGQHGKDYIYPDPAYARGYASADYFIDKGMSAFRLPFRWERLQPTRGAAFDWNELTRLTTTVQHLTAKGATVILDPHNDARYRSMLVGSTIPNDDFADFWGRLADEFKTSSRVIFGLMNEPHDLPTEQWVSAANAAIGAIRRRDAQNLILVPGNAWTGAQSWSDGSYGTPNAVALLRISDPGHHFAYEVHQYLDADSSGRSPDCVSSTIGSARLRGFTAWLRAHERQGFLAEFGGGPNPTCLSAMQDLLAYVEANADVWLGWTYWAAGPWWGDYFMSLEPKPSGDAAQMRVLEQHL